LERAKNLDFHRTVSRVFSRWWGNNRGGRRAKGISFQAHSVDVCCLEAGEGVKARGFWEAMTERRLGGWRGNLEMLEGGFVERHERIEAWKLNRIVE
jgi:hypothetical protein